ncbi:MULTISPECIES: 4'-phosphopantetheinyl transferase family protein [Streptomyces]|uniref:4'-phosphopantetheinyl transferase family protein n=1 Tax=Streptomyces TaxID=1883 RepID=UPI000AF81F53|nr:MULTISPECIES: 4'-phosphopantetheinyl transferase superfamily protein [Streptomyces]MCH0559320.1 4'-phosphopantetheinyl transferase superfamily protein [Streptomyces sp. MUM 16J]
MTAPPVPTARDIEVWSIPLRQPPRTVDRLRAVLDPHEARRARGDPRYAVAHAATRQILAARLGRPAHTLRRTLGPNGKPRLTGAGARLRWNLSTGDGWALLAVLNPDTGPSGTDVGVDVQRTAPEAAALRLSRRYYPEAEAEQIRRAQGRAGAAGAAYTWMWACKEAYVKAFGSRLTQGLRTCAPPPGSAGLMRGPLGECWIAACPADGTDYRAAVALTGPVPPQPLPRLWAPDAI